MAVAIMELDMFQMSFTWLRSFTAYVDGDDPDQHAHPHSVIKTIIDR